MIYDAPRTATVICLTSAVVWTLRREVFKKIQQDSLSELERLRASWLVHTPEFAVLSPADQLKLVRCLQPKVYDAGEYIYKEGVSTNECIFIETGKAAVFTSSVDISNTSMMDDAESLDKELYVGRYAALTPSDVSSIPLLQSPPPPSSVVALAGTGSTPSTTRDTLPGHGNSSRSASPSKLKIMSSLSNLAANLTPSPSPSPSKKAQINHTKSSSQIFPYKVFLRLDQIQTMIKHIVYIHQQKMLNSGREQKETSGQQRSVSPSLPAAAGASASSGTSVTAPTVEEMQYALTPTTFVTILNTGCFVGAGILRGKAMIPGMSLSLCLRVYD